MCLSFNRIKMGAGKIRTNVDGQGLADSRKFKRQKKGADSLDKGMPEKAGSCRCHLEVTRNQSSRV